MVRNHARRSGVVQLAEAAPRFERRVLDRVAGSVRIAQHRESRSVAGLEVRSDQGVEVSFPRVPGRHHRLLHKILALKTQPDPIWFQDQPIM